MEICGPGPDTGRVPARLSGCGCVPGTTPGAGLHFEGEEGGSALLPVHFLPESSSPASVPCSQPSLGISSYLEPTVRKSYLPTWTRGSERDPLTVMPESQAWTGPLVPFPSPFVQQSSGLLPVLGTVAHSAG